MTVTVFILFDARDHYGPYYEAAFARLDSAQAFAQQMLDDEHDQKRAYRTRKGWSVIPPATRLQWHQLDDTTWHSTFGEFEIRQEAVR